MLENLLVTPTDQAGGSLFNIFFRPGLVRRQERSQRRAGDRDVCEDYGLYAVRGQLGHASSPAVRSGCSSWPGR